ncbi:MAG: hypothetical protein RL557_360 [archaeon]|jgi:choline kinase
MDVALVYMVAGLSSRFGGKIKQFARVGPQGETFIEISLNQAMLAGEGTISKIIFVVGKHTEAGFRELFKDSYRGIPIVYARQDFEPALRDRPWGTADAACCAAAFLDEPAVICNGDDLYGESSLKTVINHLHHSDEEITIGIALEEMIPAQGAVTRGIFKVDNTHVVSAEEIAGITQDNWKDKVPYSCLCNMNLFGLQLDTLRRLSTHVDAFKKIHIGDRKKECYIHIELLNVLRETNKNMKIYPMREGWLGLTNPEDEEMVREKLKNQ